MGTETRLFPLFLFLHQRGLYRMNWNTLSWNIGE
jgi:hypothetical protein